MGKTGVFVLSYPNFIGVLDSGLGGISVLKALKRILPQENYYYFADKDNAPYGTKSDEEIIALTDKNARYLISLGCKAIVIACNTATSVASHLLRKKYNIPIIGLEPAIKPAIKTYPKGKILVMATPVTLTHGKFQKLLDTLGRGYFTLLPAPRLVEYVESGFADREEMLNYLRELLWRFNEVKFDACVLGCTHFPFVKNEISEALGYTPSFFDGAQGTAFCLKNTLSQLDMLNENNPTPLVVWNTKYDNNLQNRLLYNNK